MPTGAQLGQGSLRVRHRPLFAMSFSSSILRLLLIVYPQLIPATSVRTVRLIAGVAEY